MIEVCLLIEANKKRRWGAKFAGTNHFVVTKLASENSQWRDLGVELMWAILSVNAETDYFNVNLFIVY